MFQNGITETVIAYKRTALTKLQQFTEPIMNLIKRIRCLSLLWITMNNCKGLLQDEGLHLTFVFYGCM